MGGLTGMGGAVAAAAFGLYEGLGGLAAPLVRALLRRRLARGREHPDRWPERLGRAGLDRPPGRLVWLHAASVGEALSALPLIERLRADRPDLALLLTTGTVTSAELMADRLPAGVLHQFVPVDLPNAVDGFLDHWRPDLALWFESELWPVLLRHAAARAVPLVLVNGRMSPRSHAAWRRLRPLAAALLGRFDLCLAQSGEDAERLRSLGARAVASPGNLKNAAAPLPCDEAELESLRGLIAGRPVWLAASTHAGEETIVAEIHAALAASLPELITVIVPRHPRRGRAIRDEIRTRGLAVLLRSDGPGFPAGGGIYIADTIGELGLWYRLADLIFIGKTLAGIGGQNPMEAARLGRAILHGPDMTNFPEAAAGLAAVGGAATVPNPGALGAAVLALLQDAPARRKMAAHALAYAEAEAGALDRVMAALVPRLPSPPPSPAEAGEGVRQSRSRSPDGAPSPASAGEGRG